MHKRMKRRLFTVLTAAVVPVLMAPANAHAVSGTVIMRLYNEGANWENYRSNPHYESAQASSSPDNACDDTSYNVEVNVYVVKFEGNMAKIRSVQFVMDNPVKDYILVNAETAYYHPTTGERVGGPGLQNRMFPANTSWAHVIPYGDRWIKLDSERKSFTVKWTMRSGDDSSFWCNVVIYAHYYRTTASSGGGGGGGGGCAAMDDIDDAVPTSEELASVTDPVTMPVDAAVGEAVATAYGALDPIGTSGSRAGGGGLGVDVDVVVGPPTEC